MNISPIFLMKSPVICVILLYYFFLHFFTLRKNSPQKFAVNTLILEISVKLVYNAYTAATTNNLKRDYFIC